MVVFIGYNFTNLYKPAENTSSVEQATPSTKINKFHYKGKGGVDALTLLKDRAEISLDNSGMVSVINEKKADSSKHEYWAFYVNGKLANVGPAEYSTKDSDLIEWKIEKY